jgi:hypothetical protein
VTLILLKKKKKIKIQRFTLETTLQHSNICDKTETTKMTMQNSNDKNQSVQQTTKPSLKRSHDDSTHEDEQTYEKKLRTSTFNYDKDFHTFQRSDEKSIYTQDNTSEIYKVNVKKSNNAPINRIGFGKTLHRMNVKNINACKMVSKNTICVHLNNRSEANKLVESPHLKAHGYEATIPSFYRSVVGVIKNVPTDISAKEIYDEIKDECEPIKIERMTRRMPNGLRNYALNVKIHFAGDTTPPHVTIYHGRERVQAFIAPVLQCTGCLRYGHHVKACKASSSGKLCSRCGSKGHERDRCDKPQPTCAHCKSNHEATARECPERVRQNNIRILMTGEKLSFREVIEKYPQYTSQNQFELLENLHNFPPLQRNSYKNTLLGKKQKMVLLPQRSRRFSTPNQPEKFSSHFTEHFINTEPTEALGENSNRVTEFEKIQNLVSQESSNEESFAKGELVKGSELCQPLISKNLVNVDAHQSEGNKQQTENNTTFNQQ